MSSELCNQGYEPMTYRIPFVRTVDSAPPSSVYTIVTGHLDHRAHAVGVVEHGCPALVEAGQHDLLGVSKASKSTRHVSLSQLDVV